MTKTKGLKLINELIAKYGDVDVARLYDHYATMIYDENDKAKKEEDLVVSTLKLSSVTDITSWDEYKRIEAIVLGKARVPMIPVEVPESKAIYDTDEQKEIRKKHRRDLMQFLAHSEAMNNPEFREELKMFEEIQKMDGSGPSPKDYGMMLDNSKKR